MCLSKKCFKGDLSTSDETIFTIIAYLKKVFKNKSKVQEWQDLDKVDKAHW